VVIVAVDTSQHVGGVSLARDGALLGEERFGAEASHLVALGESVERLLRPHHLAVGDIDRVALVSGPGSFTGLRVGMAWAKGLHAARGVELATIGTLELMALPHLETHATVCTMLDARKGEVYAAVFARYDEDRGMPLHRARAIVAPCAAPAGRFAAALEESPGLLVGGGVARYLDDVVSSLPDAGRGRFAEPLDQAPSVSHLALAAHRFTALEAAVVPELEPDYIRSSEAELGRLRGTAS
jgi:tRNA threonylcarbamoyladenosine biosynthesis protein TsaB